MVRNYFLVTKPWIVLANLLSAAGGFLLAAHGHIDMVLFSNTMTGIALVVASGCVFNNYIDRNTDIKMARTNHRVLANRLIPLKAAILYASLLGIGGVAILWFGTQMLSLVIVLLGFTIYVIIYSLHLKYNSAYSTVIGSLAGAAPPLAAYCAVSNHFDLGAIIVLAMFSLWQIPHSYAITIYRYDDYASAKIPVMPVKMSIRTTKNNIFSHIIAFILATQMLTIFGYTGYAYFIVATVLGLCWLHLAWSGYKASNDHLWAKKMYTFSILTIFILSIMMSLDFTTPIRASSHFQ